jgi:hypothetical protein
MKGINKSKVNRASASLSVLILFGLFIFGFIICYFLFDLKSPFNNNHSLRNIKTLNLQLPKFNNNNNNNNNNNIEIDIPVLESGREKRLYSKKDTEILYPTLPTLESDYEISYPSSLLDIIKAWNPDKADVPESFHEQLYHFNYSNPEERKMAEIFRNKELPFKVYDIPEFEYAIMTWDDTYLTKQLKKEGTAHVEESSTNHFMFWKSTGKSMKNWKQPTTYVNMDFPTWLSYAKEADRTNLTAVSINNYIKYIYIFFIYHFTNIYYYFPLYQQN